MLRITGVRRHDISAILIGTPVYQGTLSGQAKVIMDRMRAFVASNPHALRGKLEAAVADGGDRIGGQEEELLVRTSVQPSGQRIKVQME